MSFEDAVSYLLYIFSSFPILRTALQIMLVGLVGSFIVRRLLDR